MVCAARRPLDPEVTPTCDCLAQAFGGETFKLKFGHHGGNHPIRFEPTSALSTPLPSNSFCSHPPWHGQSSDMTGRPCALTAGTLQCMRVMGRWRRRMQPQTMQPPPFRRKADGPVHARCGAQAG